MLVFVSHDDRIYLYEYLWAFGQTNKAFEDVILAFGKFFNCHYSHCPYFYSLNNENNCAALIFTTSEKHKITVRLP